MLLYEWTLLENMLLPKTNQYTMLYGFFKVKVIVYTYHRNNITRG